MCFLYVLRISKNQTAIFENSLDLTLEGHPLIFVSPVFAISLNLIAQHLYAFNKQIQQATCIWLKGISKIADAHISGELLEVKCGEFP